MYETRQLSHLSKLKVESFAQRIYHFLIGDLSQVHNLMVATMIARMLGRYDKHYVTDS